MIVFLKFFYFYF